MKVQNGHEAGVCITSMKSCYVEKQKPYVDAVNKNATKVFLASGGKDWLIEPHISREFMSLFRDGQHLETSTTGEEPQIIDDVLRQMDAGSKSISVFFENEGHFLQKFRAQLVANVVIKMLKISK